MSLTVTLDQEILNALEEEATARSIPCEQIIREAVEERYSLASAANPEYEAWFRAMYEEGKAAYERGEICSHEEVKQDMAIRRKRYLTRLGNPN